MTIETPSIRRRVLLGGTAAVAVAGLGTAAAAEINETGDFDYAVQRSEGEWREMLGDEAYAILREGETEKPHTSPLTDETRAGSYACRGCDLKVYDARWKVQLDKGWVFFRQSQPNALLMSIDEFTPQGMADAGLTATASAEEQALLDSLAATEVHCRRCGSHIGHMLIVGGPMLHCINGTALTFTPTEA